MFLSWRKPKTQRDERWPSKQKFCEQVDFTVELFDLDPELPEIRELKESYEELSTGYGTMSPMWYLQMLNPNTWVHKHANGIVIHERMLGHVLSLWSLVRHHCSWVDEKLTRIVADGDGTHLFDGDWEMVKLDSGAINPHRLDDPGNRYRIACGVIREFTGIDLVATQQVFIGGTKTITVTKAPDGTWSYELEQLPKVDTAPSS